VRPEDRENLPPSGDNQARPDDDTYCTESELMALVTPEADKFVASSRSATNEEVQTEKHTSGTTSGKTESLPAPGDDQIAPDDDTYSYASEPMLTPEVSKYSTSRSVSEDAVCAERGTLAGDQRSLPASGDSQEAPGDDTYCNFSELVPEPTAEASKHTTSRSVSESAAPKKVEQEPQPQRQDAQEQDEHSREGQRQEPLSSGVQGEQPKRALVGEHADLSVYGNRGQEVRGAAKRAVSRSTPSAPPAAPATASAPRSAMRTLSEEPAGTTGCVGPFA